MRRVLVALLTVAAALIVFTGTAAANPSNGGVFGSSFADGDGSLNDDWQDHRSELGNSLCYGCADSWNTDLVVLWQTILVSEELLPPSGIDGQFGPRTRDATKAYQSRYGLSVDGMVGNQTWSKADDFLYWQSAINAVIYIGWNGGNVVLQRGNEFVTGDSGAFQLSSVRYPGPGNVIRLFFDGTRIQFYSRTIH